MSDRAKLTRALLIVRQLRGVLRECEWVFHNDDWWQCPCCEQLQEDGHELNCKLAAALREAEKCERWKDNT